MTESRHIRVEYAQTLQGKKQLLSSEINLIYIARTLSKYKALRKKEFALKNQLRTLMTSVKTKLILLSSTLPETPKAPMIHRVTKRERIQTQEEKTLSDELKDIQEKLARLQ